MRGVRLERETSSEPSSRHHSRVRRGEPIVDSFRFRRERITVDAFEREIEKSERRNERDEREQRKRKKKRRSRMPTRVSEDTVLVSLN
ncbi:hypothetical protein F2Q68_00021764 [Brassica cretica]|uniref:Uncharacterized protein n=1 Tax=Brassica cretica TaxID=69181 RepID=A0A8S9FVU3_BRACR|nr:hypothetical protein F2Q68_00021764 [Brassica cretica]